MLRLKMHQPENEAVTPTDASTEEKTATQTDAQISTPSEPASETEQTTEDLDNPMVMHVPTKEELEEQQKLDAILNVTSSETERVSIDAFEYMEDGNRGGVMDSSYMVANQYYGDCAKLRLKYYDSLLADPPWVADILQYSFTFEKYDSDVGIYKPIYGLGDMESTWDDYATWYTPQFHFDKDAFTLYIPLVPDLEDGKYKLYFSYEDPDTYETLFQVTIEFWLNRGTL